MSVVVFCGPTMSPEEVRLEIDAEIRPPAARGDVLRAALDGPSAIGLVDGYFARVPAVWHKEILWAMSQGIHVFGAGSMGALRAAELAPFGMEGVGEIFEQYRSGGLLDDDEVAVVHASEERGYVSSSEAMVNVRATLLAAERAGAIGAPTYVRLEAIMKALPYPDRSYPDLLKLAEQARDIPVLEIQGIQECIPAGRVNQKKADGLLMLRLMHERGRHGWVPKQVTYRFASTDAWEALRATVTSQASAVSGQGRGPDESLLMDELLGTGHAAPALNGALARALCLEVARRSGLQVEARAVEAVVEDFRRERGLLAGETFDRWLDEQRLDDDQLTAYFRREAIVRRLKGTFEREMFLHLVDHLRGTGEYGPTESRAARKQRILVDRGLERPELADTPLSENDLWRWYFSEYLQQAPPANLEAFAHNQNTNLDNLRTAALREYCYLTELKAAGSSKG